MATKLFSTLKLRAVEFRNRIFVSPMCQYSCADGLPTDWHLVHLGSRAVGGAGLVIMEATSVTPEGRITPYDMGLWNDAQRDAMLPITRFIAAQGAMPGIQLAHAGRKASTAQPWHGGGPVAPADGGWQTVAPSPLAFDEGYAMPRELTVGDLDALTKRYADAARRAAVAGFRVVELHLAHGYLLHQFLSPLTNQRRDEYGGSFDGRVRLPLRVVKAVRDAWPDDLPLFVRISATDWVEGGWDLGQSVALARLLKDAGVDLVDCSSGGLVPHANIAVGPGYQVPFASAVRSQVGIATGAVGLITDPKQAERILQDGDADAVLLAREMLRDPYWPMHAARALGEEIAWPAQYVRAKPR